MPGVELIKSPENKIIKKTSFLKEKKHRDKTGCFIIEGERFVNEIPEGWELQYFILSERFCETHNIENYQNRSKIYVTTERVFCKASAATTPQGILAVCNKKCYDIKELFNKNGNTLLLVLEGVSDPGNVGTMLRIADASNAGGVILSKNCADIYSPKAIQAAAGSIFHTPVVECINLIEILKNLKNSGFLTFAAHLRAENFPYSLDFTRKCAIMIGNESGGLSDEASGICDYMVKIPIPGKAESLNASVAAGILMYEAVRQRIKLGQPMK